MPVPDFQSLMLPLLQFVADGNEHTVAASRDPLAEKFELTEEERKERLPSNAANRFHNRIAWAKTYLERAGLITKIRRGYFKISPSGLELLNDPPDRITIGYLERYPSFVEFRTGTTASESEQRLEEPKPSDQTPEEALELAYQQIRNDLAAELITLVRNGTPEFFEQLVVDLLLNMGYGGPGDNAGTVTSPGADGGIDGIINEDQLGLDVIYVQAKRWENNVGRPEVQKFVGALHGQRARKGVFITTSTFSSDAREYVKTIDPRVVLIDGFRLAQLMIEFNIGVSEAQVFRIKRVDSDYFDDT